MCLFSDLKFQKSGSGLTRRTDIDSRDTTALHQLEIITFLFSAMKQLHSIPSWSAVQLLVRAYKPPTDS